MYTIRHPYRLQVSIVVFVVISGAPQAIDTEGHVELAFRFQHRNRRNHEQLRRGRYVTSFSLPPSSQFADDDILMCRCVAGAHRWLCRVRQAAYWKWKTDTRFSWDGFVRDSYIQDITAISQSPHLPFSLTHPSTFPRCKFPPRDNTVPLLCLNYSFANLLQSSASTCNRGINVMYFFCG